MTCSQLSSTRSILVPRSDCLKLGSASSVWIVIPSVDATVGQVFRRFGADEWDALRQRFNAGARAVSDGAPAVGIRTA